MALIKLNTRSIPDNAVTPDKVSNNLGRRNLIINGAMQVAQRVSYPATQPGIAYSGYYTVDRYAISVAAASAGRLTMSQSNDAPEGFGYSLKLDCTTADTSIASGERLMVRHKIEGQNLQHLKKGTSNAKSFTVSFYVKGNAAATYSLSLYDGDNGRSISKTFAVTTSWNRIELTFAGDTTGAFNNDANSSLVLDWFLNAGSDYTSGTLGTSWATNNNATRASGISSFFSSTDNNFFITGIQLEVGDTATPFEHRSFGEELSLCQRYYQTFQNGQLVGTRNTSTRLRIHAATTVHMRANPTIGRPSGTEVAFQKDGSSLTSTNTSPAQGSTSTSHYIVMDLAGFTGAVDRTYGGASNHAGITVLTADAEL